MHWEAAREGDGCLVVQPCLRDTCPCDGDRVAPVAATATRGRRRNHQGADKPALPAVSLEPVVRHDKRGGGGGGGGRPLAPPGGGPSICSSGGLGRRPVYVPPAHEGGGHRATNFAETRCTAERSGGVGGKILDRRGEGPEVMEGSRGGPGAAALSLRGVRVIEGVEKDGEKESRRRATHDHHLKGPVRTLPQWSRV